VLPKSESELLEETLDRAFPGTKNRQVVTLDGVRYEKRFAPQAMSNSGKSVKAWKQWWEIVP